MRKDKDTLILYQSSEDINIAMERGEVEARAFSLGSIFGRHADWIQDNKIVFLAQVGAKRDARLADVPLLTELAKTDEQRQILQLISAPTMPGMPYVVPPDVPDEQVSTLRSGLAAAFGDKDFLTEMKKLNVDIDPMSGDVVAQIVGDTVNASAEIVAAAKAAMQLSDKDRQERQ